MSTDKSKEDHLRRWTWKRFLVIFCGQSLICELILALVSLWLLVNSIKKENPKEKTSDWFFFIILLKDIFYYYIIILSLFGFQRGYGMTKRSDFILTEINGCYNSNDRWKFILFFD